MRILDNRNSQVVMCLSAVLLASNVTAPAKPPDNAALLYYQAFLIHGEPNQTSEEMKVDFGISGGVVTDEISRYFERNRHVIDLVVKAANIPTCDWGYDYSQGRQMRIPRLPHLWHVCLLLRVEPRAGCRFRISPVPG